jgi:hypothetical protein
MIDRGKPILIEAFDAKTEILAWKIISTRELLTFLILGGLTLKVCLTGNRWFPILDSANLIFHEAGHPIVGILSSRLMVYGGTLGQLVFPSIVAIRFFFEKSAIGFSVALLWVFENLLNIARYMADARSRLLPLVGGGEHDWTEILSRWHVLNSDIKLARGLANFAILGILATAGWLCRQWLIARAEDRRRKL